MSINLFLENKEKNTNDNGIINFLTKNIILKTEKPLYHPITRKFSKNKKKNTNNIINNSKKDNIYKSNDIFENSKMNKKKVKFITLKNPIKRKFASWETIIGNKNEQKILNNNKNNELSKEIIQNCFNEIQNTPSINSFDTIFSILKYNPCAILVLGPPYKNKDNEKKNENNIKLCLKKINKFY